MSKVNSLFFSLREFLLKNKDFKQTIIKNTFWLSFGEIVGRLLRIIIIVYAARVLGAAGWGAFSYLTSLSAIFVIFSDIGLSSVMIREGAKTPTLKTKYFSTILSLKAILTLISFLIIVFAVPQFTRFSLSQTLLYAIGLLFIFDSLRRFGASLFRAEEKMELEAITNIITQAIIVVAGFAALLIVASPESLALAYAAGAAIGLVFTLYLIRHHLKHLLTHFDKNLLKPIIAAAWPLSMAGVFGVLIANIDTVIIGWFYQASQVGFYAAAQKPIAALYLLPALITGAFFPALARFAPQDPLKFRRLLEEGLKVVFLIALPLTAGIILTAEQIVRLVYGAEYLPAAGPLRILAFSLLTVFPIGMIINAVFAHNRQRELLPVWGGGALFNFLICLLLIPPLGISGAAWATLLTQVGVNSLIWRKMKRIADFSVVPEIKYLLLATFMMSVAIMLAEVINLPFILIVPLAIAVYLWSLAYSGETTLNRFRQLLKKRGGNDSQR
jgi:O-antigen/teichoic acid export membrane protein